MAERWPLVAAFSAALGVAIGVAIVPAPPTGAATDTTVEQLIEQGHWIRARVALERDLAARPDDPVLLHQMARVTQAFGDLDAAKTHAERAVKLAPNDAVAHARLADICGESAQKAGPLHGLGLAREFRREADAALALDPMQKEAQLDLISFYQNAPGIVGGDKKKAKTLLDAVVSRDPAWAWQARERYASEIKDTTALGGIYRDAVARHPDDYRARLALAGWLAAPWRGTPAESESQVRAALALDPGRSGAYTILAILQAREGRWDDLEHTLAEAETQVPDDLAPCYQAGRICLVEKNEAERAERYFRHYLTRPPEAGGSPVAAAHWRLGLALEKQGRKTEAVAEIETATRLDPRFEPAKKDLQRLRG
jgi:tetratricopeptide (TPR) repeat protein